MNISLSCAINHTGYGIASLNIIKELHKNNNISYFPIGQPMVDNESDYKLITELYKKGFMLDANAPYIKIWHQFDLAQRAGRGKYYAYPFFELDKFNQQELLHLNIPDSLFVSSSWAKQILIDNGIQSHIDVVPLGVNREIFNENYTKKDNGKYIFLNIGKWEIRKGHDILLQLFLQAFPNEQDVELWICAAEHTNSYSNEEDLTAWKNMYNHPRIKIIPGVESHQDLAHLMSQSDCGLFPSRAEGWNLELLEMMSMGKPVIATNYSAHTEYCNKDNTMLIDIDDTEPAFDNKAFKNQGNWARITSKQKNQCIDHMRSAYKNRLNTNFEGIKTANKYTWTNSANIIERCIAV